MEMAVKSMVMTPGAIPRPGRVPEQSSIPRNLFWMAAELGVVFCEILLGLGFSPRGQFMVQKVASGGARGGHTTPRRGLGFFPG